MNWRVIYRPLFLRDLARLPDDVRTQVEHFAFNVMPAAANPFAVSGLQKMTGYKQYYKARFGEFRVGLKIDKKARVIEFQRALNRRDIYRHFP